MVNWPSLGISCGQNMPRRGFKQGFRRVVALRLAGGGLPPRVAAEPRGEQHLGGLFASLQGLSRCLDSS